MLRGAVEVRIDIISVSTPHDNLVLFRPEFAIA